jgi:hypothetical protein
MVYWATTFSELQGAVIRRIHPEPINGHKPRTYPAGMTSAVAGRRLQRDAARCRVLVGVEVNVGALT